MRFFSLSFPIVLHIFYFRIENASRTIDHRRTELFFSSGKNEIDASSPALYAMRFKCVSSIDGFFFQLSILIFLNRPSIENLPIIDGETSVLMNNL